MPDLDPGYADRQAARLAAYDAAMANHDTHIARAAIDNCAMCDHDGYRPNGTVCDHVDRTETHKRGIAACRAALTKGRSNQ